MKNRIIAFIFLVLAFSCQQIDSNTKVNNNIRYITTTTDSINIDSTTENRYAYIVDAFLHDENLYIEVDYVDYLTGEEAIDAEWRDQAYFH